MAEDSKIDFPEFLQIQLLRTGVVDRDTLEEVKSDFEKLAGGQGGPKSMAEELRRALKRL